MFRTKVSRSTIPAMYRHDFWQIAYPQHFDNQTFIVGNEQKKSRFKLALRQYSKQYIRIITYNKFWCINQFTKKALCLYQLGRSDRCPPPATHAAVCDHFGCPRIFLILLWRLPIFVTASNQKMHTCNLSDPSFALTCAKHKSQMAFKSHWHNIHPKFKALIIILRWL